jgi:hypothetical protein
MTNWKDVAIGAVSSLGVTILGGVGIYYLTREPPAAKNEERLVYEVQHVGEFQSENTRVAIQTLRITNDGTQAARDVRAVVEYPTGVKISDHTGSLSSGPAGTFDVSSPASNRLDITIPSLAPAESLRVSVVLDQGVKALPELSVRSPLSVGRAKRTDEPAVSKRDKVDETLTWLMPGLVLAQGALAYLVWVLRRRRGYSASPSNAAFALVHQGDADLALHVLDAAMLKGGAGADEFAIRALCLALKGDFTGADRSLSAAAMFGGRRASIVVDFNRTLIALIRGDEAAARASLLAALERDRQYVLKWAPASKVFEQQTQPFPAIRNLLDSK